MSFLAKLFLDNTERQILNADILIRQATDWLGRPESMPQGGLINVKLASTHETMFWEWMVSPTMMKEGYIRFYKHDGMSKLTDLEFWDCYCVDYYELFDDSSNEPLELNLTFSPGIIRFKNVVFEKNWKVTNIAPPSGNIISYNEILKEEKLINFYFTDENKNEIDDFNTGDNVFLNIETKNCIGKKMNFNLDNKTHDFKYQGKILKNDQLSGYTITSDKDEIELEVIKQKN